jgi:uncharacterized alkaline shock family protein YloU
MSDEIRLDGIGLAPGVLDTIVTLASQEVEGVAAVGAAGIAGLVQKGVAKGAARAVDVCAADDGSVSVTVHIQVYYGQQLKVVAEAVQAAIAEAVTSQVGVAVSGVDVFVDGLVFEK